MFTLKAGTYYCHIIVPGRGDKSHQAFLKTNAGAYLLVGTTTNMVSSASLALPSIITGIFTLAADTKLVLKQLMV